MKKVMIVGSTLVLLLTALVGAVSAYGAEHGTVRGAVYLDVNGDGRCVDTGVAGEEPVEGITIQFLSSDEKQEIYLSSGKNGTFGLADAGFSNWKVTAQPNADWVVTSLNPQYAYIHQDNTEALGVNFCVAKAGYWQPGFPTQPIYPGGIILPESGAPAVNNPGNVGLITAVLALAAFGFILTGFGLELNRRLLKTKD
jgi:hypothetical protein